MVHKPQIKLHGCFSHNAPCNCSLVVIHTKPQRFPFCVSNNKPTFSVLQHTQRTESSLVRLHTTNWKFPDCATQNFPVCASQSEPKVSWLWCTSDTMHKRLPCSASHIALQVPWLCLVQRPKCLLVVSDTTNQKFNSWASTKEPKFSLLCHKVRTPSNSSLVVPHTLNKKFHFCVTYN